MEFFLPDRSTVGEVTLFPLTYVSAPSHGSRMTQPDQENNSRRPSQHLNIGNIFTACSHTHTQDHPAFTFPLGAGGAAEGAVLVFNEVAAENDILTRSGIFTPNPDKKEVFFLSLLVILKLQQTEPIECKMENHEGLLGGAIFDVIQQTLGHQRVLVEVHEVRGL